MSAAVVILPQVWASVEAGAAEFTPASRKPPRRLQLVDPRRPEPLATIDSPWSAPAEVKERGNVAFYRKYTEAMLRRSMKLSMAGGRIASLLGRELFRSNVTHYKVEGFGDSVIFVADVQKCVSGLTPGQQYLVRRIGLQEYTLGETAAMTGLPLRTVVRRYNDALDELTRMFLQKNMLEREMSEAMKAAESRG